MSELVEWAKVASAKEIKEETIQRLNRVRDYQERFDAIKVLVDRANEDARTGNGDIVDALNSVADRMHELDE